MSNRKLIVGADDFGLTKGVVDGIVDGHERGIITSTSAMVNMPAIEYASKRSHECQTLDVGVHLNFTAGSSILPPDQVPSLLNPSGQFWSPRELFNRRHLISLSELKCEFQAQVARFTDVFGVGPSHATCHHTIYTWPPFYRLFVELGESSGMPVRNSVRVHRVPTLPYSDELVPGMGTSLSRRLTSMARKILEDSSACHPDYFVDQFSIVASNVDALIRLIESLPTGTCELVCHPAFVDQELVRLSSYAHGRQIEQEVLTDARVKRAVDECGVQLWSYGQVVCKDA